MTYLVVMAAVFLSAVVFMGCDRRTSAWGVMDSAEVLMEEYPDSSLQMLEGIRVETLGGPEERARHALLLSMAFDKNFRDTTTFAILQPAIDYYLKHGTPDEKLRTLYYKGRIFQNGGENDKAMESFLKGKDVNELRDSLTYARLLVAQGTLYHAQYKGKEQAQCNLEAARLFDNLGKYIQASSSYSIALGHAILYDNRSRADSIMAVCQEILRKHPETSEIFRPSFYRYKLRYGNKDDIDSMISGLGNYEDLDNDLLYIAANASIKMKDGDRALDFLNSVDLGSNSDDSMRYFAFLVEALELKGDYKGALEAYGEYNFINEEHHQLLINNGLLFAEKKYGMQLSNFKKIQRKNETIIVCVAIALLLIIAAGLLYYRNRLLKSRHEVTEKENERLILARRVADEEKNRRIAESEHLKLEVESLNEERMSLQEALERQKGLDASMQKVVRERLAVLDGLLASEITSDVCHSESYRKIVDMIRSDRQGFLESARKVFAGMNPAFMCHLVECGLTMDELNFVCLYAMGLRGKEVGEYMQMKRHYIMSSSIRKKLGMDPHDKNLGPYIQNMVKSYAPGSDGISPSQ